MGFRDFRVVISLVGCEIIVARMLLTCYLQGPLWSAAFRPSSPYCIGAFFHLEPIPTQPIFGACIHVLWPAEKLLGFRFFKIRAKTTGHPIRRRCLFLFSVLASPLPPDFRAAAASYTAEDVCPEEWRVVGGSDRQRVTAGRRWWSKRRWFGFGFSGVVPMAAGLRGEGRGEAVGPAAVAGPGREE